MRAKWSGDNAPSRACEVGPRPSDSRRWVLARLRWVLPWARWRTVDSKDAGVSLGSLTL